MTCPCVSNHNPEPRLLHRHHILPLSWGGKREPANEIKLCPTTHENVHTLLNHYVRAGTIPSYAILRTFGAFARGLAAEAWMKRPSDKPPYTSTGRRP